MECTNLSCLSCKSRITGERRAGFLIGGAGVGWGDEKGWGGEIPNSFRSHKCIGAYCTRGAINRSTRWWGWWGGDGGDGGEVNLNLKTI